MTRRFGAEAEVSDRAARAAAAIPRELVMGIELELYVLLAVLIPGLSIFAVTG